MAGDAQGLTQEILTLKVLVAGMIAENRRQEGYLRAAEKETEQVEAQCNVIEKMSLDERSRQGAVLGQYKAALAQAIDDRHVMERRLHLAIEEMERWRERYLWVDEERQSLERQLDEMRSTDLAMEALPVVEDSAVCPSCGGEHMVGLPNGRYECPYCLRPFEVEWGPGVSRRGARPRTF